jgi:hypothetical protein
MTISALCTAPIDAIHIGRYKRRPCMRPRTYHNDARVRRAQLPTDVLVIPVSPIAAYNLPYRHEDLLVGTAACGEKPWPPAENSGGRQWGETQRRVM